MHVASTNFRKTINIYLSIKTTKAVIVLRHARSNITPPEIATGIILQKRPNPHTPNTFDRSNDLLTNSDGQKKPGQSYFIITTRNLFSQCAILTNLNIKT